MPKTMTGSEREPTLYNVPKIAMPYKINQGCFCSRLYFLKRSEFKRDKVGAHCFEIFKLFCWQQNVYILPIFTYLDSFEAKEYLTCRMFNYKPFYSLHIIFYFVIYWKAIGLITILLQVRLEEFIFGKWMNSPFSFQFF